LIAIASGGNEKNKGYLNSIERGFEFLPYSSMEVVVNPKQSDTTNKITHAIKYLFII
jgi:hypothetical protein